VKVSILIPVYNASPYLSETLESALNQTYSNCEIIAVDDGSEDDSVEVIESIMDKHKNVLLFKQDNKGACAARNLAFQKSTGDLILYLDGDDIISENKVEAQVDLILKHDEYTVISGQWGRFSGTVNDASFPVRFLDKDWEDPKEWLINSWKGKGMAQTSVWLTPRQLVIKAGPWNEKLQVNQDGEFFGRVLLNAGMIKYCREAKVYYRTLKEKHSVSKILNESKAESLLLSYQLLKSNALKIENSDRMKEALLIRFLSFIYQFYSKYPALVREARKEIIDLGFSKLPIYGGRYFKLIASLIGFENTLKMRSYLLKY